MFFQSDDQLPNSPKHRALAEMALDEDLRGPAALGMWVMNGAQCQASLTDGIVTHRDALRIFLHPQMVQVMAEQLVRVGLWHAPGHDCPRCVQPPAGAWVYHDWFDMGYDRADQVTVTRRKRKELKDQKIINAVWARDCVDPAAPTVAECRYCGTKVNRKDTRSKGGRRPHLDHVDPTRADGPRNLVIACEDCNRTKGNRTPAQADMVLRPAPRADVSPKQPPQPAETTVHDAEKQHASPKPRIPQPAVSVVHAAAAPAAPGGAATTVPAAAGGGHTTRVSPELADAEMPDVSPKPPDPRHAGPEAHDAETPSPRGDGATTEYVSPPPGAAETPPSGPVPARCDSPVPADAESPAAGTAPDTTGRPRADHAPTTARPRTEHACSGTGLPAQTRKPPPDHAPTTHRPRPDHANEGVPARATGARVGQAGSGQGQGWGPGKGSGPGTAGPPAVGSPGGGSSRRRRRRGRGRSRRSGGPVVSPPPTSPPPASPPPAAQSSAGDGAASRWDAGPAPQVPTAGRFGSPWHRWSGPPSFVTDSVCDAHGLDEPCRKCSEMSGDADA